MTTTSNTTYVVNQDGEYFIQMDWDNNQFGFALIDDDRTYAGGLGLSNPHTWTTVKKSKVPRSIRKRLDYLLQYSDVSEIDE